MAAKPGGAAGCLVVVVLAVGVIWAIRWANSPPSLPSGMTVVNAPRDDLELFVARFGPPDTDESAEHEKPRPPIVTRLLTYSDEHVRVAYRANVQVGSPPPYDGKWKIFGFLDPRTDAVITPAVAVERLSSRDKQKQ